MRFRIFNFKSQKRPPGGRPNRRHPTSSIVLLTALFALLVAAGVYFARLSGGDPNVYRNDFNVYYFAAREVAAGRDPYQNSLGDWTPYLYPPLLAIALVPLALLPLPIAAFIWFSINAAALGAALWMAARLALESTTDSPHLRSSMIWVVAATGVVLARFMLDNFAYGQVNLLVAALAVAHLFLLSRRPRLAALALALAASIKLTPLVLLAYHLARRRLHFALWVALFFAALTLASLLPFRYRAPAVVRNVISRTVQNGQGFNLADAGNQSLRGALARGAGETGEAARRTSTTATRAIAIALVALACLLASRSQAAPGAAPFFCLMVMLSPLSWKAHYVVLILPVACVAAATKGGKKAAPLALLIVVGALFNLTSPRLIGLPAAEAADEMSLVLAGAALLFLATLTLNWQAARRFVNLKFPRTRETGIHEHERARRPEG